MLRFFNALVLVFSVVSAAVLTWATGLEDVPAVVVPVILFVVIYLGLAKLYDKYCGWFV